MGILSKTNNGRVHLRRVIGLCQACDMLRSQLLIWRRFSYRFLGYRLPEVQLSVFVQLIQILYGYMHPIVSGKCLSNKNVKNGLLKSIKNEFKMSDSPLPVGIWFEYPNAFARLIDDFYHSNHDLLLEGIRLQYLQFWKSQFLQISPQIFLFMILTKPDPPWKKFASI